MAQPDYVPTAPRDKPKVSERLPPPKGWRANRPAEVVGLGGQPLGNGFGVPGPDQGYALKLAHLWEAKLVLAPGEDKHDVLTGGVAVALKRAALFGRAPVIFDIEVAFAVWGYLASAGADLVAHRKAIFGGCSHDYLAERAVADGVPDETLRLTPVEVRSRVTGGGWRELLQAA